MSAPSFRHLQLETIDQVTVVAISTSRLVEPDTIQEFGDELNLLVEKHDLHQLVLNFGHVRFLSSAAIAKLFSLKRKVDQAGGDLRLCAIPADLMQVFRLMNPFPIPIHPDEASAVAAMR